MKTLRIAQRTGITLGIILSAVLALIPSGLYVLGWYMIPKTFLAVFLLTTVGGIFWSLLQLGWGMYIVSWWFRLLSR